MIPSEKPFLLPQIWVVAINGHTARVFKKNNRGHSLFNEVFSSPLENIGAKLGDFLRCKTLDRLVLVGKRSALAHFYKFSEKSVYIRVTAEIPKDLGRMKDEMLMRELAEIIWF